MKKSELFDICKPVTLKRSEIELAEYNPRIMTDTQYNNLKKSIKKYGLAGDIIVNEKTMSVISGHQRLKVLDEIHRGEDYQLPVKLHTGLETLKDEVEMNVVINNPNVQGDYDPDRMAEIMMEYPDIDFEKDLLFDKSDIDYIFSQTDMIDTESFFEESKELKETVSQLNDIDNYDKADREEKKVTAQKLREINKEWNQKKREGDAEGTNSREMGSADYMLTFIFKDNHEKQAFLKKALLPQEKFFKSDKLLKLLKDEYQF